MILEKDFSFFDWEYLQLEKPTDIYVKKLSDMKEHFIDNSSVLKILDFADLVLYKVEKFEPEKRKGNLIFSVTSLYPGTVGREYFFTQGHYHQNDFAEIYICLKGKGLLLLKDKNNEQVYNFEKGSISHINSNFAHRVVNIGDEMLKFISVYNVDAGFDYEKVIKEGGFSTKIVKSENSKGYKIETL